MRISEVIVVEGKNDVEKVLSAVDADVVSTSGSHISKELINMLQKLNNERGLILFMDPDNDGNKIRARLVEELVHVKHAFLVKELAQSKNDIGIEHASVHVIRDSLKNVVSYDNQKSDLLFADLITFNLANNKNSQLYRKRLCNYLNIPYANAKTLYKRLLMLNINKTKLALIMESFYE